MKLKNKKMLFISNSNALYFHLLSFFLLLLLLVLFWFFLICSVHNFFVFYLLLPISVCSFDLLFLWCLFFITYLLIFHFSYICCSVVMGILCFVNSQNCFFVTYFWFIIKIHSDLTLFVTIYVLHKNWIFSKQTFLFGK